MADNITKPSRSYSTDHENDGREFDEDPLVELARIVSDDGSFFQSTPAKPADLAGSGSRADAFSADLEAELMEQFEASFAGEAAGAVDAVSADEPEPATEVEGVSEHVQYTTSDSQALSAMTTAADMRSEEVISTEYERSGVYEAPPANDADDRYAAVRPADQAGSDLPADPPPDDPGNSTLETAVEPIQDPYGIAPDPYGAAPDPYGAAADEAIAGTSTGAPLPSAFEMEFAEALADTASPPIAEDFTPEFGVEAYGRDPEFQGSQAADDGLADDDPDYMVSQYAGQATDDDGYMDDVYDGRMEMPPPVPARSGGRKGLIAVVGVLAVVVLGGGVAAYISKVAPNDPAMPAPVIKAESGDVKVMADAGEASGTAPSVLEPLAGQQAKSEEKLIDRIEEPQQIARVVLPGPVNEDTTQLTKPIGEQAEEPSGSATDAIGKTIDRVMQDTGQPAVAPKYDPIGPRKVRTVVVKPDGSIVSNNNATALAQPSLPVQPVPPTVETMEIASVNSIPSPEPTPVKTMEITSAPVPGETTAGSGEALNGASPPAMPTQVANVEPSVPVTETGDAALAMAAPTGAIPRPRPANAPDAVVARAPSTQTTQPAARSTREPVNLLAAPAETDQPRVTASTTPTATAPTTTGQSGYVVQVSSQRSADQAQASFADMKRHYRSVLGGFEPNIQRADLGAKGTYYRVRVGPMASREAALRLCEQLKSVGGNCFVTR